MKYRMRKPTIEAIRFDGTFTGPLGVQFIDDWLHARDLENCEVTCQGTEEPLALDLNTDFGIFTVEKGDYVFAQQRMISALKAEDFEAMYEAAD